MTDTVTLSKAALKEMRAKHPWRWWYVFPQLDPVVQYRVGVQIAVWLQPAVEFVVRIVKGGRE